MDIRNIADEWGGIDEGIMSLVHALNLLGINTTGSCEGHVNRSSPAPWIKVTAPNEPVGFGAKTDEYKKWQAENKKLLERTRNLLAEFYNRRSVPDDAKINIDDSANAGFWLHNGGNAYKEWRRIGSERIASIQKGERVEENISPEESEKRAKRLPIYQKEMHEFAEFLNLNNHTR